jgi:predicted ester cyclase
MDPAAHKATIRRLVEIGINRWQPEIFEEAFTPAVAARASQDFGSFKSAFSDWEMEPQELIAEGDVVVARFKCRGTHSGRWMGHDATGKRMEVDEVFFFWFRDGLIENMWSLEDTWTRQQQLGF